MRKDWRQAATTNDPDALARLISEGISLDSRDHCGQTALMLAAQRGNLAVVSLLIMNGANLDVTAKHGLSALMLAVISRHVDVASPLVEAGADTGIRGSGAPGFAGKTACDLAIEGGLDDLADLLGQGEIHLAGPAVGEGERAEQEPDDE